MVAYQGAAPWLRGRRAAHYGGATDKRDADREIVPYAWSWYRQLQLMRGSAYTTKRASLVHAETLCIARVFAGLTRAAERRECNAQPITADERLAYWVTVLAVPVAPDDTRQDARLRCAAKYQAAHGATAAAVDAACARLLGDSFVRTWRFRGADIDSPPDQTFWPGINAGPSSHDLGGGAWSSARARLIVETRRVPGQSEAEYQRLVGLNLFQMLDPMIDSHAAFDWSETVEEGFLLDIDQMDYSGFDAA
jgi:hypothetical protein